MDTFPFIITSLCIEGIQIVTNDHCAVALHYFKSRLDHQVCVAHEGLVSFTLVREKQDQACRYVNLCVPQTYKDISGELPIVLPLLQNRIAVIVALKYCDLLLGCAKVV